MSWLGWLLVAFIVLVLLVNFPKQTLVCLGVAVGGAALFIYVVFIQPQQEQSRLEQQVTVKVTYDAQACSQAYPLLISVENISPKTVIHVSWRVEVYRPGYSSNLAGYPSDYDTDKIIGTMQRWSACYVLPKELAQKSLEPNTLEYRISGKYSRFAD
jgi:hypothetical protein